MTEKKKKTKKDKKWIQSAIKRPGTFTAKEERNYFCTASSECGEES